MPVVMHISLQNIISHEWMLFAILLGSCPANMIKIYRPGVIHSLHQDDSSGLEALTLFLYSVMTLEFYWLTNMTDIHVFHV